MCQTMEGPSMQFQKIIYQLHLKHSEKGLLFSGKHLTSFHS